MASEAHSDVLKSLPDIYLDHERFIAKFVADYLEPALSSPYKKGNTPIIRAIKSQDLFHSNGIGVYTATEILHMAGELLLYR